MLLSAQEATWAEVKRLRAEVARLRVDVIEYEAQMHAARGEATERLREARHWREQAKRAEDEVLRVRAAVPTREEVERAVGALLQAHWDMSVFGAEFDREQRCAAARAARRPRATVRTDHPIPKRLSL